MGFFGLACIVFVLSAGRDVAAALVASVFADLFLEICELEGVGSIAFLGTAPLVVLEVFNLVALFNFAVMGEIPGLIGGMATVCGDAAISLFSFSTGGFGGSMQSQRITSRVKNNINTYYKFQRYTCSPSFQYHGKHVFANNSTTVQPYLDVHP